MADPVVVYFAETAAVVVDVAHAVDVVEADVGVVTAVTVVVDVAAIALLWELATVGELHSIR